MRQRLIAAVLAGLMTSPLPYAASAQSLRETLALAYNNSQVLEQNRALLRATDENAATALAALRPSLAAGAEGGFSEGPRVTGDNWSANVSLSTRMTLYAGGSNRLAHEVAKENILAARERLRSVEQQVLLNAALAFFNLRKADEVVRLQTNNLGLIGRELEAAQDRFEVGAGTRTDVALAEARLAAVQSSLAAAQGSLAVQRETFRTAVGQYPRGLGAPGDLPRPAASVEAAKSVARANAPAITEAKRNVTVAELNKQRAEASFKPSVTLQGSVTRTSDAETSSGVSVSVEQTIYQGGRLAALHRQSLQQVEASRAELLTTVLQVEEGVGSAWAELNVAQASLVASEEQTRASRLAFEGLREEAALGARTTLDVLDAEQSLLDAETSRAAAVNDRYIAAYRLMSAMGVLTADRLNLGVVIYDPAAYYETIKDAPVTSDRGRKLDNLLKALGRE